MATFGLFGDDTLESDENKSDEENESEFKPLDKNKQSEIENREEKSSKRKISKWSQAIDEYDNSSFLQNLVGSTTSDCSRFD
jgi:hypothetical protein